MNHVTIYTDGGCYPNPGPGGWGAVLLFVDGRGEHQKQLTGAEKMTTNNRMELSAVIHALEMLNQPCRVTLYTDSQYVKNGITEWIAEWMKNNWRTKAREDVKNRDLWERLHAATQRHIIDWQWVRGHSGNHYNEVCDQLATSARLAVKE